MFSTVSVSLDSVEPPDPQMQMPESVVGLGCVETADDFRLDFRAADIWANEWLRADLSSDRHRVGGYWGLGCAGEVKLPV